MLRRPNNLVIATALVILSAVLAAQPAFADPLVGVRGDDGRGTQEDRVTAFILDGVVPPSRVRGGVGRPELDSGEQSDDLCFYTVVDDIQAGDPRLEGHDPNTGVLYRVDCPDSLEIAQKNNTSDPLYTFQGYAWAANGDAPVAPPPDPAVLAQQAYAQLKAPPPVLHFGPTPDKASVNYPVWLWVDDPGPLTASVSLRGVTVTATATLSTVTWSMGEPAGDPDKGATGQVPAVVCEGPGTQPSDGDLATAKPACGYTYTWRSTKARTDGAAKWPVTATVDWTVNWTSNVGPSGTLGLQTNGATALTVGEWRSVLVAGNGN